MNRRVWLASYPKSGNTWMRMLIGCLAVEDGGTININQIAETGGIASARLPFDYATMIDSSLLTFDEIDRLRPRLYEEEDQSLAEEPEDPSEDTGEIIFSKAHDAYILNDAGEPLLAGARGARGVILIVRDPRDVVASLANHNQSTIDEAIALMNDPDGALCAKPDRLQKQLRQIMLSWSGHIASWLDQTDIPVHLVRYEALKAEPVATFMKAMTFSGKPITLEAAERAVALADFSSLQAKEAEQGFGERPPRAKAFFRKGQAGGWREELTEDQVRGVEQAHRPMMERLGYKLSLSPAEAR